MTTQLNIDLIYEENPSYLNKKEIIPWLGKPKNLSKSISKLNDTKYFADNSSEGEEEDYLFSHNDFSDAIKKRLDEHSDDEYSYLKNKIDSYINVNDEEAVNDLVSKKKSDEDFFSAEKCNFKIS